jgi:hypothetical protein
MIVQKGTKTLSSTIINIQLCCTGGGAILYAVKQSHLFLFIKWCTVPLSLQWSSPLNNTSSFGLLGLVINLCCGFKLLLTETASFNLSSCLRKCLQLRYLMMITRTCGTASGMSLTKSFHKQATYRMSLVSLTVVRNISSPEVACVVIGDGNIGFENVIGRIGMCLGLAGVCRRFRVRNRRCNIVQRKSHYIRLQ